MADNMRDLYDSSAGFHAKPQDILQSIEEVRQTDPVTGGQKGKKLARVASIPPDVLIELAEHYGKGEEKYPDDDGPNWQKGYSWRLSADALLRHMLAWMQGEDIDEPTGSSHLIAVAWHAFALRWYQLHGKGTDDIPSRQG